MKYIYQNRRTLNPEILIVTGKPLAHDLGVFLHHLSLLGAYDLNYSGMIHDIVSAGADLTVEIGGLGVLEANFDWKAEAKLPNCANISAFLESSRDPNTPIGPGRSRLLHLLAGIAVNHSHTTVQSYVELLKTIMIARLDINMRDVEKRTPLDMLCSAVMTHRKRLEMQTSERLKERKVNLNKDDYCYLEALSIC